MKTTIPRYITVAAIFSAVPIALPPAEAMSPMERLYTTQTTLIRHEATEHQRKVAEARTRAYMTAQFQEYRKKNNLTAKMEPKEEAKHRTAMKKKLPRRVAVDVPLENVPPEKRKDVKKDVMLFDTQSESLIGNSVYDVVNPPAVGSTTKFETFSAQYIGTGGGLLP